MTCDIESAEITFNNLDFKNRAIIIKQFVEESNEFESSLYYNTQRMIESFFDA